MAAISSSAFGAFIEHDSNSNQQIKGPDRAVTHDKITAPTNIELDTIEWGHRLNGPSDHEPFGPSKPPTPGELERSQPPTPKREDAVDALAASSPWTPRNRWRLAASGTVFFFVGMTDAVVSSLHSLTDHRD